MCSICMYAFVWAHVYFSLDPINQVSSTSAITYLARLLFLVSQFYSSLGKFSTFLLILWNALFPSRSLYMCVHIYMHCVTCVLCRVQFFCNPIDGNPQFSYIHGIFQARVLELVAISFSRGSSLSRIGTHRFGGS